VGRSGWLFRQLTTQSINNIWLHRFAVLTAAATLFLIWMGGLVTSHGVGMAVPDWPTTYGYNMFAFPYPQWVGGVFYEHSHRLIASGVGLLTAILAIWVWLRQSAGSQRRIVLCGIIATLGLMGVHTQTMFVILAIVAAAVVVFSLARAKVEPQPLRWVVLTAFALVLIQGVLGGLRVTQLKDEIGIFHGTLAQIFFALVCTIAIITSARWARSKIAVYDGGSLRYLYVFATGMIFLQLIIGATMRHQHAGLAIPDFPLAYGKLWPATDATSIETYNQLRIEVAAANPITAAGVLLQMVHRLNALAVLTLVLVACVKTVRRFGWRSGFSKGAALWSGLIICQALLGAATIWTNKAADVATAHVALGALSLVTGTSLILWASHCFQPAARTVEPLGLVTKSEVPA
jgi:heme a synthase